jgi:hypothetical protein
MTEITRQHLEDAALAAGKVVVMAPIGRDTFDALDVTTLMAWRPHLDDGDAIRLCTHLRANVSWGADWVGVLRGTVDVTLTHDGTPSDADRAARDAIVLCAAAVGEQMRGGR